MQNKFKNVTSIYMYMNKFGMPPIFFFTQNAQNRNLIIVTNLFTPGPSIVQFAFMSHPPLFLQRSISAHPASLV